MSAVDTWHRYTATCDRSPLHITPVPSTTVLDRFLDPVYIFMNSFPINDMHVQTYINRTSPMIVGVYNHPLEIDCGLEDLIYEGKVVVDWYFDSKLIVNGNHQVHSLVLSSTSTLKTARVAQWIRRQTHKQNGTGSSLVRTINSFYKMGINILFRSNLI